MSKKSQRYVALRDKKRRARSERVRLERQVPLVTIDGGIPNPRAAAVSSRRVGAVDYPVYGAALAALKSIYGKQEVSA